jgi:hypothetical protein
MQKTIYPEVKVADEKQGICEYIASDEAMDADCEIVRVGGWHFDRMEKNAPFVNSHGTYSIDNQLGKVLGAQVKNGQLVETVQWALDVPENKLAQLGWAMTKAGYLKAVSVGFLPTMVATRLPAEEWPSSWQGAAIADANRREGKKVWEAQRVSIGRDLAPVKTIYIEQQQTELSACIVGSNPNAVAKSLKEFAQAHKAGVLSDADLDLISLEYAKAKTANSTVEPAVVEKAWQPAQMLILLEINKIRKRL